MKLAKLLSILAFLLLVASCSIDDNDANGMSASTDRSLYYGDYEGYWTIDGVKSDTCSLHVGIPMNFYSLPHRDILALQLRGDSLKQASQLTNWGAYSVNYYNNGYSAKSFYFVIEPTTDNISFKVNDTYYTLSYAFANKGVAVYNSESESYVVNMEIQSLSLKHSEKGETGKEVEYAETFARRNIKLVYTGKKRK